MSEALAAVRLEGFEARAAHALSGGQRHRVALARAIAARPAALLLDEPLSALDPSLRNELRAAIAAAQADYGPAMLLVTHDLEDAAALADRVAVLLDGQVAQLATAGALFAGPATLAVARFLGIYQELPGRVRSDGGIECALGNLQETGPYRAPPGSCITVAFRAESVRLGALPDAIPGAGGRIVAVRHRPRGTTVVVQLGNGAGGARIEAAADGRDTAFLAGEPVTVALDPRGVAIYPA